MPRALETDTYVGKRVPMNASAGGLAILTHLPKSRVGENIETPGLPALTARTISEREELYREIQRVHERGYSINDEGYVRGHGPSARQ